MWSDRENSVGGNSTDLDKDMWRNWGQEEGLLSVNLVLCVRQRECGVTVTLCLHCFLYISMKPVVGRVLVISARVRERLGLSPLFLSLGDVGNIQGWSGWCPRRPTRPLPAGLNTLRCIVRQPWINAATWVSRKRSAQGPTDRTLLRLSLPHPTELQTLQGLSWICWGTVTSRGKVEVWRLDIIIT